jgi:hypothetical protein
LESLRSEAFLSWCFGSFFCCGGCDLLIHPDFVVSRTYCDRRPCYIYYNTNIKTTTITSRICRDVGGLTRHWSYHTFAQVVMLCIVGRGGDLLSWTARLLSLGSIQPVNPHWSIPDHVIKPPSGCTDIVTVEILFSESSSEEKPNPNNNN